VDCSKRLASQGSGGQRAASNTLLTRLLNAHPRGVPASTWHTGLGHDCSDMQCCTSRHICCYGEPPSSSCCVAHGTGLYCRQVDAAPAGESCSAASGGRVMRPCSRPPAELAAATGRGSAPGPRPKLPARVQLVCSTTRSCIVGCSLSMPAVKDCQNRAREATQWQCSHSSCEGTTLSELLSCLAGQRQVCSTGSRVPSSPHGPYRLPIGNLS
jgi:hypothetical protein